VDCVGALLLRYAALRPICFLLLLQLSWESLDSPKVRKAAGPDVPHNIRQSGHIQIILCALQNSGPAMVPQTVTPIRKPDVASEQESLVFG